MTRSTNAALAHALWEMYDGDHVDPEGDAQRLIALLARQGVMLVKIPGAA